MKSSRSASRHWAISISHARSAATRPLSSSHRSLKQRSFVELALGSSWLGSLFGGFLKYTAMAMGLKNLYLVAFGLCLLFIHPRAPNLINLRSAGTMPA